MRPVFEHALVDALGLPQIRAPIGGDAGLENVMVAALDDVDRVDLHIAQMLHRRRNSPRSGAERRAASSRWARSQICRALALVRGRVSVARGIARQCNRIRREKRARIYDYDRPAGRWSVMTFLRIRHPALSFCLSMTFSENRYPLFRIMLYCFGRSASPTLPVATSGSQDALPRPPGLASIDASGRADRPATCSHPSDPRIRHNGRRAQ